MRNKNYPIGKNVRQILAMAIQGNELKYFLAGSFGFLVISTQIPHLAASKPQVSNLETEIRQRQSPSHATLPLASTVHIAPENRETYPEQSNLPAICEKETGKKAGTYPELTTETGDKLASHVQSRYKVAGPMAKQIVATTISLSRKNDMDPYLALGIIASESSFNHKARSGYGATGLMQVYAPVHKNVLEDLGIRSKNQKVVQKALTDQIQLNVAAGIRIYKTYEKQYGSRKKALQAYNGAKQDASYSYANKVLAMQEQLQQVAPTSKACA